MPNPPNKIKFTSGQRLFLKENYAIMTNKQLADALGLRLTRVRMELYSMGLKRMELQYWTDEQTKFLTDNYREFGDTELAEIFEVKWHKPKGWTKKHIEKKRRYLKLKRTAAERKKIHKRNTAMGRWSECAKKRWATTGQAPIGEKRIWFTPDNHPFVVIKTKNGFVHYNRWLWEKEKGKIPPGMNVCIFSSDPLDYTIKDLKLLTNAELSARNSKRRIPSEFKETQKLIKAITKITIKHEKKH